MTRTWEQHPGASWREDLLARHHRRQHAFDERSAAWLPGWRTRRRRRGVVVVMGAGFVLVLVAAAVAFTGLPTPVLGIIFTGGWVGGTLLVVAAWSLLRILTGNVTERTDSMLDEREIAQVGRARSVGLQVAVTSSLVPMLLLILGSRAGESSTLGFPAGCLLAVSILLGGFTPSVYLAWHAPDLDAEDFA